MGVSGYSLTAARMSEFSYLIMPLSTFSRRCEALLKEPVGDGARESETEPETLHIPQKRCLDAMDSKIGAKRH